MLVETKFATRQAITLQRKRSKTSDNNNLAPLLGEKQQEVIVSMVLNGAACWLCVVGAENGSMHARDNAQTHRNYTLTGFWRETIRRLRSHLPSPAESRFLLTTHCHWRGECTSAMCRKQLESNGSKLLVNAKLASPILLISHLHRMFSLYLFKSMWKTQTFHLIDKNIPAHTPNDRATNTS